VSAPVAYRVAAHSDDRDAIEVEWPEVARALGREHRGSARDDEDLVAALLAAGAPAWVGRATGYVTPGAWGVIGPVRS